MKRNHILLLGVYLCLSVCCFSSCGRQCKKEVHEDGTDSTTYTSLPTDTMTVDVESETELSWEHISSDGEALPLNFEKWLTIMNHIRDNWWSRPTAKMLADAGLEMLYETDEMDKDSIKNVHFIYGRQTKCVTDSAGEKYYTFDGDHAILFEVSAYTSSSAEICFHNPADLRDFVAQAVRRGVAENRNGRLIVCDKPMGEGIHKITRVYGYDEKQKGTYQERYYLYPEYVPNADWQVCYVTLDFLRLSLDVE